MSQKKIAIISHQYGKNICGGAEFHARILAEHLTKHFEVTVLTSKNESDDKDDLINGLKIKRFSVKTSFLLRAIKGKSMAHRLLSVFVKVGFILLNKKSDYKVFERSLYTPDLLQYLRENKDYFDVFIFFSYLFYPSYFGMQIVQKKAVFIPLAHDEPTFYKTPKKLFSVAALTLFNTQVEMELVKKRVHIPDIKCAVVGCGIDENSVFEKQTSFEKPYLVYIGRIVKMKGADVLINYFVDFVNNHPQYGLKLLLLGNKAMELPQHNDVVYLGFTEENKKFQYLSNALALVNPSYLESLSLVVLESFFVETPVIVNGACEVLAQHIEKSKAGFTFTNYNDFEKAVLLLLNDSIITKKLGQNGKRYYQENYSWKIVERKIVDSIHKLISSNNI